MSIRRPTVPPRPPIPNRRICATFCSTIIMSKHVFAEWLLPCSSRCVPTHPRASIRTPALWPIPRITSWSNRIWFQNYVMVERSAPILDPLKSFWRWSRHRKGLCRIAAEQNWLPSRSKVGLHTRHGTAADGHCFEELHRWECAKKRSESRVTDVL